MIPRNNSKFWETGLFAFLQCVRQDNQYWSHTLQLKNAATARRRLAYLGIQIFSRFSFPRMPKDWRALLCPWLACCFFFVGLVGFGLEGWWLARGAKRHLHMIPLSSSNGEADVNYGATTSCSDVKTSQWDKKQKQNDLGDMVDVSGRTGGEILTVSLNICQQLYAC